METITPQTQDALQRNVAEVKKFAADFAALSQLDYINIEAKGPFFRQVIIKPNCFTPHIWAQYKLLFSDFVQKLNEVSSEIESQSKLMPAPKVKVSELSLPGQHAYMGALFDNVPNGLTMLRDTLCQVLLDLAMAIRGYNGKYYPKAVAFINTVPYFDNFESDAFASWLINSSDYIDYWKS